MIWVLAQVALEELQDLKGVWSELSKVWEQIDQMKEQPWVSVQPRKLRQNLDGLLNQLKNFPARLRQYASYEFVQRLLKGYMKVSFCGKNLKKPRFFGNNLVWYRYLSSDEKKV